MSRWERFHLLWQKAWWSALISISAGLLLLTPLGGCFNRASYDLPSVGRENIQTNIVIVELDDASLVDLGVRTNETISRTNHANLLRRLQRDGARLVFFDLTLDQSSVVASADEQFADAMRAHGKVILGGFFKRGNDGSLRIGEFIAPAVPLRPPAATAYGHLDFWPDPDLVVRKFVNMLPDLNIPAAAWVAVTNLGVRPKGGPDSERWLNYYGPAHSPVFQRVDYFRALDRAQVLPQTFSNKIVLVGGATMSGIIGQTQDVFGNPWRRWGRQPSMGVEIHATIIANLLAGDWLRRVPWPLQGMFIFLLGFAASLGLAKLPPRRAAATAALGILLIFAVSFCLQRFCHWWWTWLIPIAQIPLALAGSVWLSRGVRRKPTAFISYRRADGGPIAALVLEGLRARDRNAWLDVEYIQAERDVEPELEQQINTLKAFILVLTPGVMEITENTASNEGGTRTRSWHDPNDDVRREIAIALNGGKVFAVLICNQRDRKPTWNDEFLLPASILDLINQPLIYYAHPRYGHSLGELVKALGRARADKFKVFICHTRKDECLAVNFRDRLAEKEVPARLDPTGYTKEDATPAVMRQIKETPWFLLILTPAMIEQLGTTETRGAKAVQQAPQAKTIPLWIEIPDRRGLKLAPEFQWILRKAGLDVHHEYLAPAVDHILRSIREKPPE